MGARNVILGAVAALAVTALLPSYASAFCRMSTCHPNKETCGPDPDNPSCDKVGDKTHARLFWSQPCVGFSIQQDTTVALPGSPADRYALVEKIANTGFATWQNATCADGKAPSLAFAAGESATVNVKKNGVSILTAPILLDSTVAFKQLIDKTVSVATLPVAVGDQFTADAVYVPGATPANPTFSIELKGS